ncbi:adenosylmethionine decarboxylase [Sphingomonas sp. RT2P30]|uniref:adenosylmethionine decarboxylase n=1 Tax=Parasphingomonas halimpatiens TaxID=3096162 RepID=UPI002FCB0536
MDFDGTHLLADLFGCTGLDDVARIERALRAGVVAAGATLLDLKLHSFGPEQGVTGVALLAESHISIHTWPERDYAAIDIFLCGGRDHIDAALAAIVAGLEAHTVQQQQIARGYRAAVLAPVSR